MAQLDRQLWVGVLGGERVSRLRGDEVRLLTLEQLRELRAGVERAVLRIDALIVVRGCRAAQEARQACPLHGSDCKWI